MINSDLSGFFFIDKPEDCSSFDLIRELRRKTSCRKFGHTGTLDPFATGLVILSLNKATKLSSLIINSDKEYLVKMELGIKTDTGDRDGKIIGREKVTVPDTAALNKAVKRICKTDTQIPPAFSAKKIRGKASYKFARNGEEVNLEAKKIHIYEFNVISCINNMIIYRAKVSKGTYIRTLSETFAEYLGTIAYTTDLRRLSIGTHSVKDAVKPELITSDNWQNFLKPITSFNWDYPVIYLRKDEASSFSHGSYIPLNRIDHTSLIRNPVSNPITKTISPSGVRQLLSVDKVLVYSEDKSTADCCLGIGKISASTGKDGILQPVRVL